MRFVTIDKLETGMVSAYTIQDIYGRVLVEKGRSITSQYIYRLRSFGFAGIYIDDSLSRGIEVRPTISEKLRYEAMSSVQKADPDRCANAASEIVGDIVKQKSIQMDMLDMRSSSDHTYAHSVNVAVISGIICLGLQLSREEMKEVVLAGLMHDFGKLEIPDEILNKPGRLQSDEYKIMKSHAEKSYEKIRYRKEISEDVKMAVLHHHENVDGTGYPDGLTRAEQNIYTRIIHVADVYDALVSRRPYKEPYFPHEALEYLMGGCGTYFDRDVVSALANFVPLYPKGTEVLLSNGEKALVCENSGKHNLRPIVRLLSGRMLDLRDKENLGISIIDDNFDRSQSMLESERARQTMAERKILCIVESDQWNRDAMYEQLRENYEVHAFSNGTQALKVLLGKRKQPDLLILDANLDDMEGMKLVEQLRWNDKTELPVMFVADEANHETILRARSLKVEGYILRPYQPAYLQTEIERILNSMVR